MHCILSVEFKTEENVTQRAPPGTCVRLTSSAFGVLTYLSDVVRTAQQACTEPKDVRAGATSC